MTILLDTSVLVAFVNPKDERHRDADTILARAMRGEWGAPLSTEFVLGEGFTLLRKRPGRRDVSEGFRDLLLSTAGSRPPVRLHTTTKEEIDAAVALHFGDYDRGLSLPDAHLVVVARRLGGPIASFDAGFDGLVTRVP
ncbi:MAG: type II toxin-antitoxin system VapC family toxin [Methanobacteriota archaeon]